MKLTPVLLSICLCFIIACSEHEEKVNVPEVVKAKFSALYPNAGMAKWKMEDGKYEASFEQNKMETSVILSPEGNVLETESVIDVTALPQTINDYAVTQLGGKKISKAEKVTSANGTVSYEIEVDETDYLFDANGQFTGKEEEEGGEKDKD